MEIVQVCELTQYTLSHISPSQTNYGTSGGVMRKMIPDAKSGLY